MKRPEDIDELIELSFSLGSTPSLVQGGGGNLSMKCGDVMWVKASGFWLAEAHEKDMFVPVDTAAVRAAMYDTSQSDLTFSPLGGSTLRPSIETTLHAGLRHRVVAHVHSVNTIARTVREDGRQALCDLLDGLDWAWIPYARPGVPLTRAMQAHAPETADILILANHGLVVGGKDCEEVSRLLEEVERRLHLPARAAEPVDLSHLAWLAASTGMAVPEDEAVHGLATDPVSLDHARRGPLYPDHVVFLGMDCPVVPAANADGFEGKEFEGTFLLIEKAGVLVQPNLAPGALAMLRCWADVAARLSAGIRLHALSEEDCLALLGWEAEDYRRKLRTGDA